MSDLNERAPGRKPRSMPEITLIAVAFLVAVTVVIALFRGGTSPTNVDPNVLAILPFRVAAADSSLRYLREGTMDLLAAKLTAAGGPRAADPQTVMSAWRRHGGSDTGDLGPDVALAFAEGLGAGEVLSGAVTGMAAQITISATRANASDGTVLAVADVTGPVDSVAALVDQLAAQLLPPTTAMDSALAARSLGALRADLAGRAAYRRGAYDTAARYFARALAQDSTLTEAALHLICARARGADVPNLAWVQRRAWDGRDRLNPKDRALLDAFLGPRFPEPARHAELLELAERAVDPWRDNPDAWYLFGAEYFRSGAYLGHEDWATRARAAFERTVELDSAFADPLGHLIELAVLRGDTADTRRLAALYRGTSLSVRWQIAHALHDSSLAADVRQAFDTAANSAELLFSALFYGAHDDVARLLTRPPGLAANDQRVVVLLNQGRVREALNVADNPALRVLAAIFAGVNDTVATNASVRELARVVAGPAAASEARMIAQYGALAQLGQWAIVSGDAAGAARAAARLRAMAAAAPGPAAPYAAVWSALLDGHANALRGLRVAHTHADQADSLLRLGARLWRPAIENLVLALLYEAIGDNRSALAAVRRGSPPGVHDMKTWFLREEGRLAAKTGDSEGALSAYRRYLTMLSNPDGEVAATAAAVRREIDKLDR